LKFIFAQHNLTYWNIEPNRITPLYIQNQLKTIIIFACKQHRSALSFLRDDNLILVIKGGLSLIKIHMYEIFLEIVKFDGLALRYIPKQNEQICMAAVEQNGLALKYVLIHSQDICVAAIKQNIGAYLYLFPYERTRKVHYEMFWSREFPIFILALVIALFIVYKLLYFVTVMIFVIIILLVIFEY